MVFRRSLRDVKADTMTRAIPSIHELALSPRPPWLIASRLATTDKFEGIAGVNVVRLNGQMMRSKSQLLQYVYQVIKAPQFAGMNWHALFDILQDVKWDDPSTPILIVVDHWESVLSDESPEQFSSFMHVLVDTADWLSRPRNMSFDTTLPPTPFHTLFIIALTDNVRSLLEKAEALGFEIALL